MIEDRAEGLAPASSTNKEYTFGQIFKYFQYIMDLVEDEYDMNIFTPEEFFNNDFE